MRADINTPEKNIETGFNFLNTAAMFGAKLIVMPEMWGTGLHPGLLDSPFVEKTSDIIKKISKIAFDNKATIVAGSFAYRPESGADGKKVFNRVYVIDSNGVICGTYDKIQVFTKNNEQTYSVPGSQIKVIEADGIKIAPFVCFDLRFPELFRTAAFKGVDVITISSQFPTSRINHWKAMIPARAVENQCFVLASNVVGFDGNLSLGGNSMIADYDGRVLKNCEDNEGAGFADIDLDSGRNYRQKFMFLDEAFLKSKLS